MNTAMNEEKVFRFNAKFITGLKKTSQAKDWLRRYFEDCAALEKKNTWYGPPARDQKASAKEIAESYLARYSQPVDNSTLGLVRGCFKRWKKEVKSRTARKSGAMGGRPTYKSKSKGLIAEVISVGRKAS
jgi:hypothetical protein